MKSYKTLTVFLVALVSFISAPLLAQHSRSQGGLVGSVWVRENGASKIRFSACGEAICGTILWLKDPNSPAKIGQRIFYNLKATEENQWKGDALNPEDGKTYSGRVMLQGNNLSTSGCVLGGLICRNVNWTREQ